MKIKFMSVIVGMLITLSVHSVETIMRAGNQFSELSGPKDKWLALAWKNDKWILAPSNVTSVYNKVDDITTIISSVPETRFFLRAKKLRAGPIPVVGGEVFFEKPVGRQIDDICTMRGPCKSEYKLNAYKYEVEFAGIGADEQTGTPAQIGKVILRQLSPARIEQQVFVIENPTMSFWKIEVVGDFDGDGKLDVIFTGDSSQEPETFLFLSTEARQNELVGAAKILD